MRKRRLALAMALALTLTSVPVNGLVGYAEEETAAEQSISVSEDSAEQIEVSEAEMQDEAPEIEGGGQTDPVEENSDNTEEAADDELLEEAATLQENETGGLDMESETSQFPADGEMMIESIEEIDEAEISEEVSLASDESDGLSLTYNSTVTVELNESASLSVSANTTSEQITYQWYKRDTVSYSMSKLENATASSYQTESITAYTVYKCEVYDGVDTETAWFYVYVDSGLKIDAYDQNIYVELNGSKTLTVNASTTIGDLKYQWYDNGNIIEDETESSYTVENVTEYGYYYCEVNDGYNTQWAYFYVHVDSGLKITYDSSDVYVDLGASTILTVNASNTSEEFGEITYQWYRNYEELDGETDSELTVTGSAGSPYYRCEVSDGYNTTYAYFSVYVNSGLAVEYDGEVEVDLGESTILTVNANSNLGEITYQWYRDWEKLEGETRPTLTVTGSAGSPYYRCEVSDGYNTTYAYFSVYVNSGLAVEYDGEVTVEPGGSADLAVSASSQIGTVTYQWYRNWDILEGETDPVLQLKDIMKTDYYNCIVSDGYNTEYVYFNVYVDSGLEVNYDSSVYVKPDGEAILSVSATTKAESLTCQWYKYSSDSYGWQPLDNEIASTYKVTNISEYSRYYCEVSDGYNTEYAYFYVYVDSGLRLNYDSCVVVAPGGSIELNVTARTNYGELSYQWYKFDYATDEWVEQEAEISNLLTLDNVTEYCEYKCEVTDAYNMETAYFEVNVESGLQLNYKSEYNIVPGDNVELTVSASTDSVGGLSYQWYSDDGDEYILLEGEISSVLALSNVTQTKYYKCEVTDGTSTKYAYIDVYADAGLEVWSNSDSYIDVKPGSSTTLEVGASTDAGTLSYQWYQEDGYNEVTDVTTWNLLEGETNSSLSLSNIKQGGYYKCVVSNTYASKQRYFTVYIDSGLEITSTSPESSRIVVQKGAQVTLSVTATVNSGSLTYSWYDNDGNLAGSSAQLPVTAENSVYYECVVEDDYGNSVSADFRIGISVQAGTLAEGAASQVNITEAETYAQLTFVPSITGLYRIYSSGTYDTYGYLTAADGTELAHDDDEYYEYNDQVYDGDVNFGIWYELVAGQTYYIQAGFFSKDDTGSYTVTATSMTACAHIWNNGVVTKAATCAATGVKTYTCTKCGTQKIETIAKTNTHSFGSYVVTKAATALAAGTQTRTCTVCGVKETTAIAKLASVLTLNASSLKMKKKQSTKAFKVTEMAAGDYVTSVTSSNKKILKVSKFTAQGAITLKAQKKTGKAKLTVTLASGASKTITVKVQSATVKTTKISGLTKKMTVANGSKTSLSPVITPITTQQKVTCSSSNKKVVAVTAKGVMTAKKKGKAKITVKSGSKKYVITVTVK